MTTSANPAPPPADPAPSDYAELWRAIGRLEGTAAALLRGQGELKEGQQELKAYIDSRYQELKADFENGQRETKEGQQELKAYIDSRYQELKAEFENGQRETKAYIDNNQRDMKAYIDSRVQELSNGVREVNRRVDRLVYVLLGIGGAVVVSIFASRFVGG